MLSKRTLCPTASGIARTHYLINFTRDPAIFSRIRALRPSALARAVEYFTGPRRGHGAILADDLPVDDDMRETSRVLVWLVERCHVLYQSRVEYGDIGLHSRAQDAAVGEAEARGG